MELNTSAQSISHVKYRVTKQEWEALGLEKRTDYENLRRVFERIAGPKRTHFDAKDLESVFKSVT